MGPGPRPLSGEGEEGVPATGAAEGALVGAVVRMMSPLEVAFTKAELLYFIANEVSCLLNRPVAVDAVSWDWRSIMLYCEATDTT